MKSIFLVLISVLFWNIATAERMVVRIPEASRAVFEEYQNMGKDIALYHPGRYLDLVIPATELAEYQARHSGLSITQTEAELKANLVTARRDLPGYRDYATLMNEISVLPIFYPHLVDLYVLGDTWGSRYAELGHAAYADFEHEVVAIKLSQDVLEIRDKPQFYFLGTHHAREPISLEVTMEILYHLLDNYGTDPTVTEIVNSSEIWFIPLLNPDGHKLVIDQTDIWWRKNIRDNNSNMQIDYATYGNGADGVDLNRNYSYQRGNISASDDPWSVTYRGPEAFSEPETQAWRDFAESKHFLAGISYHSYGEYVMYPFGFAGNTHGPDHQEQALLADAMAATIGKQSGGTYDAMPSYGLYPVSGSSEDWAYGERGIFAYTIEMAEQFIPPASQLPQILQNHLNAAMILLQRKNYKTLTGHITCAATESPLRAKIHVEDLDDHLPKRAAYYSRADFGSYHRFLPEGFQRVIISAEGYLPQSFEIEILPDSQTILNVSLLPADLVDQWITITDIIGSPIAGARLDLEAGQSFYAAEDGRILIPEVYAGRYEIGISHPGFGSLQAPVYFGEGDLHFRLQDTAEFAADFESGTGNWQLTGLWGLCSSEQYSGSFSLADSPGAQYSNNVSSFAASPMIDLTYADYVNLQFMCKHSFPPDSDYATLRYREEGSPAWNSIEVFAGIKDWHQKDVDLSFLAGKRIRLGFAISTNSTLVSNGIYIDDIAVYTASRVLHSDDQLVPAPSIFSYPNPFTDQIKIEIKGTAGSLSRATVYNLRGQKIRNLETKSLTDQSIELIWDGKDENAKPVANGIYFLRINSKRGPAVTRKIIRLN